MSGSKGLSEQAQRIACECHNLDVLHLQNAPEYCDNADPNGCGGRFNKEDCEIYQSAHRIDAALRRAKVEALELAARELCMYCNDPGNWAPMSNSGYHQCNTPGPNMTRCGATKIHALRRELDARAAQIEEGE